jgi:Cu2+-exporting ATPase
MTCQSCAASVETLLRHVPGVEKAEVLFASQEVIVTHEPELAPFERLQETLRPAGYELLPDVRSQLLAQERFLKRLIRDMLIAGVVAGLGMVIHLLPVGTLKGIPFWAYGAYYLVGLGVGLFIGKLFWQAAWQQLKVRQLTMDTLISLGLFRSEEHTSELSH